ncbi:MAG TPA: hypothetical protein VHU80_25345 [Polyangiaceae bacterium]|nr:hypothetical protein [Polyangiaceae bacterium]
MASHSRAERDAAVAATTRSSETGPVRAENAPGAEPGAVGAETATGNLEATGSSADLSAELALYQSAHSLHFGGGTPASALQGWRRYLAEYPRGTLSAEARLNEAVCLVKLGKRTEARRLLESLSAGNPRSIERQAGELLGALGVVPSK